MIYSSYASESYSDDGTWYYWLIIGVPKIGCHRGASVNTDYYDTWKDFQSINITVVKM